MQKIAIHSVPRSGSTWLGNIFNSHPDVIYKYQPLFSYEFKDYITDKSEPVDIEKFFTLISKGSSSFVNQTEMIKKGLIPEFKKSKSQSHIIYKEVRYHNVLEHMMEVTPGLKLILLIRNPLAVINSWYNAPKEFDKEKWDLDKEWLHADSKNRDEQHQFYGYNKWKEATELFFKLKNKYSSRVYIITYIDLLMNTEKKVEELFDFSGLELNQQTKRFISISKSIHNNDPYAVFKMKSSDDDWETLPKNIVEYIVKDVKLNHLERLLDE